MKDIQIKHLTVRKNELWSVYKGDFQVWIDLIDCRGCVKWSSESYYGKLPSRVQVFGRYADKHLEGKLDLSTMKITHVRSERQSLIDKINSEPHYICIYDQAKLCRSHAAAKAWWSAIYRKLKAANEEIPYSLKVKHHTKVTIIEEAHA